MNFNNVALLISLKTGLVSPQFHIKFDTKLKTVIQEEISPQWLLKSGFISPREGRPLSATNNRMQGSGGRNTQPARESKKMKRYESTQKDPEPGIKNWGKTQDKRQHQSIQGVLEPEIQDQILPIPAKLPQEGFDFETTQK